MSSEYSFPNLFEVFFLFVIFESIRTLDSGLIMSELSFLKSINASFSDCSSVRPFCIFSLISIWRLITAIKTCPIINIVATILEIIVAVAMILPYHCDFIFFDRCNARKNTLKNTTECCSEVTPEISRKQTSLRTVFKAYDILHKLCGIIHEPFHMTWLTGDESSSKSKRNLIKTLRMILQLPRWSNFFSEYWIQTIPNHLPSISCSLENPYKLNYYWLLFLCSLFHLSLQQAPINPFYFYQKVVKTTRCLYYFRYLYEVLWYEVHWYGVHWYEVAWYEVTSVRSDGGMKCLGPNHIRLV